MGKDEGEGGEGEGRGEGLGGWGRCLIRDVLAGRWREGWGISLQEEGEGEKGGMEMGRVWTKRMG